MDEETAVFCFVAYVVNIVPSMRMSVRGGGLCSFLLRYVACIVFLGKQDDHIGRNMKCNTLK
jgi:hypothetical protein